MCGENRETLGFFVIRSGSSPRVRGKLIGQASTRHRRGLIPACAGKTFTGSLGAAGKTAHPRVCGENPAQAHQLGRVLGSSPRVRGKREGEADAGSRNGLIPACAGKTGWRAAPPHSQPAHPRVCGENGKYAGSPVLKSGSSPRVRGKPARLRLRLRHAGLIPACAGKTARVNRGLRGLEAHPRVCGENSFRELFEKLTEGSSPRVRGKR